MDPCCWFCCTDFTPPEMIMDYETGLYAHEECVEGHAELGDPTAVGMYRRLQTKRERLSLLEEVSIT